MNPKLNPALLIAIAAFGVVLIVISLFIYFSQTKSENVAERVKHQGQVSLAFSPDSATATFAKNNLSDVFLVATNQSNQKIKISSFRVFYEASSQNLEISLNKKYLPSDKWVWSNDSAFSGGLLKISGEGISAIELEAGASKNIAKLEINPKVSFSLSLHGELSNVKDQTNKNIFDEISTKGTQIFNISK